MLMLVDAETAAGLMLMRKPQKLELRNEWLVITAVGHPSLAQLHGLRM
jgi:hypothetical protein